MGEHTLDCCGRTMANTKALIVGDGAIGKTCLLNRFTNESIDWDSEEPEDEPTTFNNFILSWESEEHGNLEVEMWDTAGQEAFEQLRKLSYPGTDIYLIGYSTTSNISLNNIEHKWIPEIVENHTGDDKPWTIMVGTKKDIRSEVTVDAAKTMASKINACALIDTSAKDPDPKAAGIADLTGLMMDLAFKRINKENRPDWGAYEKHEAKEVKSEVKQAPAPAANLPAGPSNVKKGPDPAKTPEPAKTTPPASGPAPTAKKAPKQDAK